MIILCDAFLCGRIRGPEKRGVKIRPRLGDHMPFNYMRERQTLTFLFYPELKEAAYEISRIIGESITSDQIRGKTLPEIMESNQPIAQRDGYAFEEVVEADETHAVYRHYECADCYAFPIYIPKYACTRRVRLRACSPPPWESPAGVTETKCCANGDPYCEFLVEVL